MFERSESKTKNEECEIKVYALHLALKNLSIMGKKILAGGVFKYLATLRKWQCSDWLTIDLSQIGNNVY